MAAHVGLKHLPYIVVNMRVNFNQYHPIQGTLVSDPYIKATERRKGASLLHYRYVWPNSTSWCVIVLGGSVY